MKIIEVIGIFGLTATLAACDSKAPAPQQPPVPVAAAPAKLAGPAPKPADPVEARYTPAYDKCLNSGDAAQGQTLAMVDCIGAELTLQDARLNQAYKTTLDGMEPQQQPKLKEAQRAWIVFRDAKCASENQTGGSIDRIGGAACLLHATAARSLELEQMRETN